MDTLQPVPKQAYQPYSFANPPPSKKSHDKVTSSDSATASEAQSSARVEQLLPDDVEQIVTQAVGAETPSMMRTMSRALQQAAWQIAKRLGNQLAHSSQMPHRPVTIYNIAGEDEQGIGAQEVPAEDGSWELA